MIEKLNFPPYGTQDEWINKINEVIDAVNALVYEHDKDSDWYDGNHIADAGKKIDASELAFLQKENSELKDEIDRLETELERTRKALEIAVDGIKYMRNNCLEYAADYMDKADEILEQITALEQKE